jgi:BirA family biotin operon repressor/biotin-[acetyl-CoA-carboxylase] ligase
MGLSLALGVAVVEVLTGLGVPGLAVKWPNDVLREGGKLAGMLLEVRSAGALERVVIGLGVNLRVSESLRTSVDQAVKGAFDGLAHPPSRLQTAAALAAALRARTERFHREGFADTGRAWAACDFLAGAEVVVLDQGREVLSGRADGLGPEGELRVWQDGRLQLVAVGDVSVRRRPVRPESA